MYENDYSWVPGFFAGFMVVAAAGSLAIALIRPNHIRRRALIAWFTMPITISVAMGVSIAALAENIQPYDPIVITAILSAIFLPPWLVAAAPAFGFSRYLQSRIANQKH